MLKAIFFDLDGVIVDTERDGHRVAFNRAFAEFGIPAVWSEELYGELLKVGGGKERMLAYFASAKGSAHAPANLAEAIPKLHARKTALFIDLIEHGNMPLRPGVRRLMQEANAEHVRIGICTTSNDAAAAAVVNRLLAGVSVDFVLAGDVVAAKKPDPEIYTLALRRTGLTADECVVVEDSQNGVLAANGAGLAVLATVNGYTASEDLSAASAVVTCLGERGGETARVLRAPAGFAADGEVRIASLRTLIPPR